MNFSFPFSSLKESFWEFVFLAIYRPLSEGKVFHKSSSCKCATFGIRSRDREKLSEGCGIFQGMAQESFSVQFVPLFFFLYK